MGHTQSLPWPTPFPPAARSQREPFLRQGQRMFPVARAPSVARLGPRPSCGAVAAQATGRRAQTGSGGRARPGPRELSCPGLTQNKRLSSKKHPVPGQELQESGAAAPPSPRVTAAVSPVRLRRRSLDSLAPKGSHRNECGSHPTPALPPSTPWEQPLPGHLPAHPSCPSRRGFSQHILGDSPSSWPGFEPMELLGENSLVEVPWKGQ